MTANDPIKLRWKKNANGTESAFLDITLPGMQRKKEYLRILRGGDIARKESKEAERLALAICQKRISDYYSAKVGVLVPKSHRLFLSFYDECTEADNLKEKSKQLWRSTRRHLVDYIEKEGYNDAQLTISDISSIFCKGFAKYLLEEARPLSIKDGSMSKIHDQYYSLDHLTSGSANVLFSKLKACLRKAIKQGLITADPTVQVDSIKKSQARREFLSIEEVHKLMNTKYTNECSCRAFLFSCLTGLRVSDIRQLEWEQLQRIDGHWRIVLNQQKTSGLLYLDISDMAYEYMGKPDTGKVFKNLRTVANLNYSIKKWMERAGINKRISFHCARHTSAVSMITAGADIYTVSKILGHTDIKTTQIYSDVIDRKKSEAVDKIADLFRGTSGGQTASK